MTKLTNAEHTARYRKAHPEKARAAVAAWKKAHPEKVKAANAAWQQAHPRKDYQAAWERTHCAANKVHAQYLALVDYVLDNVDPDALPTIDALVQLILCAPVVSKRQRK